MTHAEFIADIQRARSFVDDRNSTMVLSLAAVDHLLAIHAAVIVLFDAEVAYKAAAICEAPFDVSLARLSEAQERYRVARTNLAALCGWKAEQP